MKTLIKRLMICPRSVTFLSILLMSFSVLGNQNQHFYSQEVSRENKLVIHIIHSKFGINWSSPGSMLKSALKNSAYPVGFYTEVRDHDLNTYQKWNSIPKHPISHMAIELHCVGKPVIKTGMSTLKDLEAPFNGFIDGYGLGVLLKVQKGHLQSADDIETELNLRQTHVGNMVLQEYLVNRLSCERMSEYFSEFIHFQVSNKYGSLKSRPLYAEGAGCSAFAIGFLQVLGLVDKDETKLRSDSFFFDWRRSIRIPKVYIGDDIEDAKIGIWGLLRSDFSKWAEEEDPHIKADFWDPEKIYHWTIKTIEDLKINPQKTFAGLSAEVSYQGNVPLISFDARRVIPDKEYWQKDALQKDPK